MRGVVAAFLVLALAGSAAAKVTADDAAQFKVGTATLSEIEHKLGKPQATTTNSDGTVVITYVSLRTHVKGATFVPVVGLFAGGASAQMDTVAFTFGPDGVLKSTSTSATDEHCKVIGGCG